MNELKKDIDVLFQIKKSKYPEEQLTEELLCTLYGESAYEVGVSIETLKNGKKQRFFQKAFSDLK